MTATVLVLALTFGSAGSVSGGANFAARIHGDSYLAMRLPRGTVVTICGAGGCWHDAVVNDWGPVKATGDIADIALTKFMTICGYTEAEARLHGECAVRVTWGMTTLPRTDVAPDWAYWHELVL